MAKGIFLILAVVSFTTVIYADENINRFDWEPVSAGPFTTWTAPLCGRGKFIVQPFLVYERTRGSFDSDGHYDSLPHGDKKYTYKQQLFMQYGITDRLEIDCQVEYQQAYAEQSGNKAHSEGFGDSYFFLRYCVMDENEKQPCVTVLSQLKIPTGKYQKANPDRLGTDLMGSETGGGSYDPGFGINITRGLKPFLFHMDCIYAFPQRVKVDGVNTRYGRYLNYDLGLEYFLSKGYNLMFEFNGLTQGDKMENGSRMPATSSNFITFSPGLGWSNDRVQTLFAYQRMLVGKNRDAKDSLVLTFVYTF